MNGISRGSLIVNGRLSRSDREFKQISPGSKKSTSDICTRLTSRNNGIGSFAFTSGIPWLSLLQYQLKGHPPQLPKRGKDHKRYGDLTVACRGLFVHFSPCSTEQAYFPYFTFQIMPG